VTVVDIWTLRREWLLTTRVPRKAAYRCTTHGTFGWVGTQPSQSRHTSVSCRWIHRARSGVVEGQDVGPARPGGCTCASPVDVAAPGFEGVPTVGQVDLQQAVAILFERLVPEVVVPVAFTRVAWSTCMFATASTRTEAVGELTGVAGRSGARRGSVGSNQPTKVAAPAGPQNWTGPSTCRTSAARWVSPDSTTAPAAAIDCRARARG